MANIEMMQNSIQNYLEKNSLSDKDKISVIRPICDELIDLVIDSHEEEIEDIEGEEIESDAEDNNKTSG